MKAALIKLTRCVAQDLGPHNIRVNAICPGGIATPIFAGQPALKGNEDCAAAVQPMPSMMQPIPRAGAPENIANAACFLASHEASFISGRALVVDGALTAGEWPHPSLGAGAIGTLAQACGVEDSGQLDMVYHSKENA